MRVFILAGGSGTRMDEETINKPKPMVEIGGKPILWHILKIYSHYGFNDFYILLGYNGYYIKNYFANYYLHNNNVTFDLKNNSLKYLSDKKESWKITLIDTGINTMTGGRIKQAKDYIDGTFMLTYGDGVADINIKKLLDFHKTKNGLVTLTAVQPEGRFGALMVDSHSTILSFMEKPKGDEAWINGGFFICEQNVINYIKNDDTVWERDVLPQITAQGKASAYMHTGFCYCMDTLRDRLKLEKLWATEKAPWKIWK